MEGSFIINEPFSKILSDKWNEIVQGLKPLLELRIPRFIGFVDTNTKAKLLVFCDASMKSYATVVYLHIERQNCVEVNLVLWKMRLASSGTGKKKGKQKHLRCKKVAWPRKTVTKRGDMRVWPR